MRMAFELHSMFLPRLGTADVARGDRPPPVPAIAVESAKVLQPNSMLALAQQVALVQQVAVGEEVVVFPFLMWWESVSALRR